MADKRIVIVFVKAPQKGVVKSRLAKCLGEEITRVLYKTIVLDTLHKIRIGPYPCVVAFSPPNAGLEMKNWLGTGYMFTAQRGRHLGERMKNAFLDRFSGGTDAVVLVGSDIPDLTLDIFEIAFQSLDDHDAVLGPSLDGGYYLIGFNRSSFTQSVFEGIRWGTGDVFGQTIDRLTKANSRVCILPEYRDIDTFDDLAEFYRDHINDKSANSETLKYLRSGEIIFKTN